jgi:hypothetical protein
LVLVMLASSMKRSRRILSFRTLRLPLSSHRFVLSDSGDRSHS